MCRGVKMVKKYELVLDDSIEFSGQKLFRIRALTDFYNVKAGDLGGYIQREKNLSHDGDAWVADNAKVYDSAQVTGDAKVCGEAEVYGRANVSGDAWVAGNAKISGDAEVSGNGMVWGNVQVYANAKISGEAEVYGNAFVWGIAQVYGNAKVSGNAEICNNAKISELNDFIVFKNHWSSGRYFTYTKSNKMWKVGCFYGTGRELIEKAYGDSKTSGDHYKAYVDFVEGLERLGEE